MHRIDYPETRTAEGYCAQISMDESADHRTVKYRLDLFQTEQDRGSKRIKLAESLARSSASDDIDSFLQEYAQSMEEVDQSLHQLLLRRTDFMSKWSVYDFAKRIWSVRLPAETTECKWVDDEIPKADQTFCQHISNLVFKASVRMEEIVPWGEQQKRWLVSYVLSPNCSFPNRQRSICGITDKKFRDAEHARSYLDRRKAWLEKHFFRELNPVIPVEYEKYFLLSGAKLPIYSYESD